MKTPEEEDRETVETNSLREMGICCETRDSGEKTACVVQSQTTEDQRDGVPSTRIEEILILQAKDAREGPVRACCVSECLM